MIKSAHGTTRVETLSVEHLQELISLVKKFIKLASNSSCLIIKYRLSNKVKPYKRTMTSILLVDRITGLIIIHRK